MLIDNELNKLNSITAAVFEGADIGVSGDITAFLAAKSKKIRPSLIFLFSKALGAEITDSIYSLACAAELAHNAALIHDDILDSADLRRGRVSLNKKLGNSLSVLSGDILLAAALKKLADTNHLEIVRIFSDCLYNMCRGEINQNLTSFQVPSLQEYIQKSKYKTAELFTASLVSLCCLINEPHKKQIEEFAQAFGAAFQIKDDLINITGSGVLKPSFNDVKNGIYTAPFIFLNRDIKIAGMAAEKIIQLVQNKKYKEETCALIKEYAQKAVNRLDFIPDNEYKKEIIKITENLYKAGIDE